MKPTNILLALSLVLASTLASHAQVGIGTSSPNAALDVTSTTQGFLPPRMTTTQRNAISSPAVGLVIFNTTTNCLNFYNGFWVETCGYTKTTDGYPAGAVFCASVVTAVVDVTNPVTGKIWMDRNLGASQVATSSTDTLSYGSLYQWGRRSDGHQCRNSSTTATLSSVDQPAHGSFITGGDWRSPQNTNLWQGVNGVNNPCPSGYRLPTETEWNTELASWSPSNSTGALASPLKLPLAGYRASNNNGLLDLLGTGGVYWSSTVARRLLFHSNASMGDDNGAEGMSVRCIKN